MVKNHIKVFARIKREKCGQHPLYDIIPRGDCDILNLYHENVGNPARNGSCKFRFEKIFDTKSEQNEVFEKIAKPMIEGVLNGYNGTVFAYGPTGSGKTYSLTGSNCKYANRGLIPRTIEYIFSLLSQNINNFVVCISYLEIYNEIAYDLLSSKQTASTLEELPRVVFLEDEKGEAHYKNLSVINVRNEQEAMQLLYLGDTKRTIAETPLNEHSSRSHCVFTLYLTTNPASGKLTRSKLNLVDLAGSERLNKIALNGVTLNEAKYINLSLHYLEQVFIALSETKRAHVPFRNSVMTFMLRDSIAGNCLTAMLATLSITRNNYEEALTTCKFAQRVAAISTNANVNESFSSEDELIFLRSEVLELRKRVFEKEMLEKTPLTKSDEENCKIMVKHYLHGSNELDLGDSRKIKICFSLLKDEIKKSKEKRSTNKTEIDKYKEIIQQKDKEISILTNLLQKKSRLSPKALPKVNEEKSLISINLSDREAFEDFISLPENQSKLNFFFSNLKEKLNSAKLISQDLATYQKEIIQLRTEINNGAGDGFEQLSFSLKTKQNKYRETLLKMQNIKSEIDFLHKGLKEMKGKLICEFKKIFNEKFGKSVNVREAERDNSKIFEGETINWSFQNDVFSDLKNVEIKSKSLTFSNEAIERNIANKIRHEDNSNIIQSNFQAEFEEFCTHTSPRILNSPKPIHRQASTSYNLEINTIPSRDFEESSRNSYDFQRYQNYSKFCETAQSPGYKSRQQTGLLDKEDCILNTSSEKLLDDIFPINYRNNNINPTEMVVNQGQKNVAGNFDINAELDSLFSNSAGTKNTDVVRFTPVSLKSHVQNRFVEDNSEKPQKLSNDFNEFMKNVPLTGEADIDDEIIKFYKMKFSS